MTGDPEVWLQTWIEATETLLEVDEAPPETCDFCLNAFEAAKEAGYIPPKPGWRP